ncbi:glycosyl transferase [Gordonia sp. TBRC 11910]|uniref:Glycosyl transferase n=1 Tax=Gordonia asplenii TaxID=2725283 RepID=A0A848KTS2_9ACTN|nr:nucleotide disphospho-sugar-binding domain-containing protein [Gordonia asplenii]NMN99902.1 glycosyl transferase [Gordonia asplenii]
MSPRRRVGLVAGPEAGHAFPAFALAERLAAVGHSPIVYTGLRWSHAAARRGIRVVDLPELAADDSDDDSDAGAKLSVRAARMALALAPVLVAHDVDVVVSDVITVAGGWAAELAGLGWVECSPHPLYLQSRGLPPIGAGMARGEGPLGRMRDAALRTSSAPARRRGARQRAAARRSIGLPPDAGPITRMVATLPGLEEYRPDWPADTHLIGPLLWEPTDATLPLPAGRAPLVMVAPSTAVTGAADLAAIALAALSPGLLKMPVRVVISGLTTPSADEVARSELPDVAAGFGRQDALVAAADVVICGGGHGMLVKALGAGVPVVTVPGGGDQWELANRVQRRGAGRLVRPLDAESLATATREVLADARFAAAARRLAASGAGVVDPVGVIERAATRRPTPGT